MGDIAFYQFEEGITEQVAFQKAVDAARGLEGADRHHATVGEKSKFFTLVVDLPEDLSKAKRAAHEYAKQLIADNDPRIADKWGAAGCIPIGHKTYLFFGVSPE